VDCRFDLKRVKLLPLLRVPAKQPEVAISVQASGISGAMPYLAINFDFGFLVTTSLEVTFQDVVAGDEDFVVNNSKINPGNWLSSRISLRL
jgi:hypothetical protein